MPDSCISSQRSLPSRVRSPTPGEHRNAAVLHGDVVDEFHDDDGFADARAAEQTDLAAAQIGFEQIDDLDSGLEHFESRRLIFERRRLAMNRIALLGIDRPHLVHRLAEHVQHAAQGLLAHRHADGAAEADRLHAAHQALGGLHRDGADAAFADVLLGFADDVDGLGDVEAFAGDADRGIDFRDLTFGELAVDGGAGDLDYMPDHFC